MKISRLISSAALSTVIAVIPLTTLASHAMAQAWDWGGDKKEVASSGRMSVPIDKSLKPGDLYVSFTDRRLYHIVKPGEAVAYPIAIPREQDDWKGVMTISDKRVNPSWTPTPTMIKENPRLPSWVPGGHPYNPLGVRALYLGSSAYRIHGTDAPWTIGEPVSKGCIRMYNKDVVDLYDQVKIGTKVIVTWNSFKGGIQQSVEHKGASEVDEAGKPRSVSLAPDQSARAAQRTSRSASATAPARPKRVPSDQVTQLNTSE